MLGLTGIASEDLARKGTAGNLETLVNTGSAEFVNFSGCLNCDKQGRPCKSAIGRKSSEILIQNGYFFFRFQIF
jgi:hypothetical protein